MASRLITICSSKLREKQLTDCTNLSGDFASMTDIFIDEGQNKIYITDEQKVSLCERNENRSMLKCQSTGDGFNSPSGIYVLGFYNLNFLKVHPERMKAINIQHGKID